jgi:hypothetical protein
MSKKTVSKETFNNLVVWCGVGIIAGAIWLFAVRSNLHLIDPLSFIGVVALAALATTGLLWWAIRAGAPRRQNPDNRHDPDQ